MGKLNLHKRFNTYEGHSFRISSRKEQDFSILTMPRLTLTNKQKQVIISKAAREQCWSQSEPADWATQHFKLKKSVGRTTICKMLKNADAINAISGYQVERKSTVPALFPVIEKELVAWMDLANAREISVTGLMVREEAE